MKTKNRGFTLIELLVAVLLLVIVVTIAMPSFQSTIQNNRVVTLANDLVFALNLARSEAIKRGVSVSICPASNSNFDACGTNWDNGWLIFVNPDENTTFANNSTEILLRAQQIQGQGMSITTNPAVNLATYNSAGFAAPGTGNLNISVTGSGCTTNNSRLITISLTGRISTTKTACP